MKIYKKKTISVSISEEVIEYLDWLQETTGASKSWLVESLLYSAMIHSQNYAEVKKDEDTSGES